MKKKSLIICLGTIVILMLCCINASAARKSTLPVIMEAKWQTDKATVTKFEVLRVETLSKNFDNRIKFNRLHLDFDYDNNIGFALECYNEEGRSIGTCNVSTWGSYADVPLYTAMVELKPEEPENDSDTYVYYRPVNVYAVDGTVKEVSSLLLDTYINQGWYKTKPVLMYAADGRTLYVEEYDVAAYKQVGWFKTQPVMMHTTDGRTMYVESYDVEAYKNVGWFKTEFTTLYDGDGNSISVPDFQVDAYKAVGWFIDPVKIAFFYDGGDEIAEFNLNTIESPELTQYVSQGWVAVYSPEELAYKTIEKSIELAYFHNNSLAVPVVIDVGLQMLTGTEYEDDIYALKTKAMDRERKKANCPISVLSVGEAASKESFLYYDVRFKVALWNISYKKITAFKTSFDCYDAFGNYVKTVTNSPCNVANLYSGEYVTYTWESEYFDKYVKTIKNLRITEVVYEDGTKWYR